MFRSGRLLTALGIAASVGFVSAQVKPIAFTDTKLKNGLRVIVSEDRSAPVVALAVHYDAGSRDERKGRTGFAHLFEHMMFKGSANVGAGEHPYLIFANGGTMNGTTNKDRTLYYEVLPSHQLDLALFLEADRMRSLDITKENLDNQRQAVQEERRLRVDNQPYGKVFEALDELAYENFAYEHSVIGSMADLEAATVDDVAAFFKTYYAPNNAVLGIVGDLDTRVVLDKVRKYFENIPSQPAAPPVDMTEPPQKEERRLTLDDPLARLARIDMAYKIPPSGSPDEDALEVLSTILSGGRSSRFNEMIVRQKQLATGLGGGPGAGRGPNLFTIVGTVAPGKTPAELEAAVEAEIERVKSGPIEAWEMDKARNAAKTNFVGSLGSSLTRAVLLAQYAAFFNKPDLLNTRAASIARVTEADVRRVASRYLVKTGRTVITSIPKPPVAAPRGGQ